MENTYQQIAKVVGGSKLIENTRFVNGVYDAMIDITYHTPTFSEKIGYALQDSLRTRKTIEELNNRANNLLVYITKRFAEAKPDLPLQVQVNQDHAGQYLPQGRTGTDQT